MVHVSCLMFVNARKATMVQNVKIVSSVLSWDCTQVIPSSIHYNEGINKRIDLNFSHACSEEKQNNRQSMIIHFTEWQFIDILIPLRRSLHPQMDFLNFYLHYSFVINKYIYLLCHFFLLSSSFSISLSLLLSRPLSLSLSLLHSSFIKTNKSFYKLHKILICSVC